MREAGIQRDEAVAVVRPDPAEHRKHGLDAGLLVEYHDGVDVPLLLETTRVPPQLDRVHLGKLNINKVKDVLKTYIVTL